MEDVKQITQILVESLMLVGELNKKGVVIELTYPSSWTGKDGVEDRASTRTEGLSKGVTRLQTLT